MNLVEKLAETKMVDYLGWKIDKIMNYEYILRKLTEYKDKYR